MRLRVINAFWLALLLVAPSVAQVPLEFELVVPDSDIVSHAEKTDQRLQIIDDFGRVTSYARIRRYDSEDGKYFGYYSEDAGQVIRWPVDDRGHMLIGTIFPDGLSPFRRSRMEIRPLGPPPEEIPELSFGVRDALRMTTLAAEDHGVVMEAHADNKLLMRRTAHFDAQLWHLAPVGQGYYRIHAHSRGPEWSLSSRPAEQPRLELTGNSPDQLWRITPVPSEPDYVILTSADGSTRDRVLTSSPTGQVHVKPFDYGPDQMWRLERVTAALPGTFEEYTAAAHELRPAEALPAAELKLVNSHRKELWVLLTDVLQPQNSVRLRIPPGESASVSLQRDPGGTIVETFERHLPGGVVEVDQFETPVPSIPRYDVSVYEMNVQSVAIDRTVPGGRVEEVNYSPRSVGWFELPAGPDLRAGTIDVYEMAVSMGNPGAARRIDPQRWQMKPQQSDPVEQVLEEVSRSGN